MQALASAQDEAASRQEQLRQQLQAMQQELTQLQDASAQLQAAAQAETEQLRQQLQHAQHAQQAVVVQLQDAQTDQEEQSRQLASLVAAHAEEIDAAQVTPRQAFPIVASSTRIDKRLHVSALKSVHRTAYCPSHCNPLALLPSCQRRRLIKQV